MADKLEFEDYPPGIQNLLKWASYHLEQLEILDREFRAWQAAQSGGVSMSIRAAMDGDISIEYDTAKMLPASVRAEAVYEERKRLGIPSRAEQAQQRWEISADRGGKP